LTTTTLRDRLDGGTPLIGAWLQMTNPLAAEIIGRAGYDWVGLDTQHGIIGYEGMVSMLQALAVSGAPAVVRVSSNAPGEIMRALDAGAQGIIVPNIDTADDARRAVAACRYAPLGGRSWGPTRASLGVAQFTPAYGNEQVVCIVQLESVRAIENLDEILAVPGVDVVYIGPNDLAITAGIAPNLRVEDPEHRRLVTSIIDGCRRSSKVVGTHAPSPNDVGAWLEQGYGMLAVYLDLFALRQGVESALAGSRAAVDNALAATAAR
jgi:4-hydroxy-2-oxoheptanedioate aldolase